MRISLYTDELKLAPAQLIALAIGSEEPDRGLVFSELNNALGGVLEAACTDEDFTGKRGQRVLVNVAAEGLSARRVMLYGVGPRAALEGEVVREFAGASARAAREVGAEVLALQLPFKESPAPVEHVLEVVQAVAEGAELGHYRFDKYRTKEVRPSKLVELRLAFVAEDVPGVRGTQLREAIARGQQIAAGVGLARDLTNEPANVLYPTELADRAKAMAKAHNLSYKILGSRDLKQQEMRLHLAVAQGSERSPRLIHLSHYPEDKKKGAPVVALVGKGLCFDAGGLSLKTSEGMMDMKVDMAGAAAVLGAMQAIADIAPDCVVHGIVAAAENMPDGKATRPGDVVKSKKGLTVEILNTDAEGRLVLADALAYAQEQKPSVIIDLATLTGACMVALGPETAAAFTAHEPLASALAQAWGQTGERFWRMPLVPEIKAQLKSEVADLKNIGKRWGGAISAALFLQHFVDADTPWAHLDIAGPVTAEKTGGYIVEGGTGFAVRTLVRYVQDLAAGAAE